LLAVVKIASDGNDPHEKLIFTHVMDVILDILKQDWNTYLPKLSVQVFKSAFNGASVKLSLTQERIPT